MNVEHVMWIVYIEHFRRRLKRNTRNSASQNEMRVSFNLNFAFGYADTQQVYKCIQTPCMKMSTEYLTLKLLSALVRRRCSFNRAHGIMINSAFKIRLQFFRRRIISCGCLRFGYTHRNYLYCDVGGCACTTPPTHSVFF